MTPEEIDQQKRVEFYAAGVNAWYCTSLEYDKCIFALSAGGVGLLVTLLTTVGVPSKLILTLYGAAIFCFLVSIVALLVIFRRNKNHIEEVLISGRVENDPVLEVVDFATICSFGLGAAFAAAVGISSAFNSYESAQKKMTTEKPNPTSPAELLTKSFTGVGRLQNSVNGIGRVQPEAGAGAPAPAPLATPAPASPTPSTPAATSGRSAGT